MKKSVLVITLALVLALALALTGCGQGSPAGSSSSSEPEPSSSQAAVDQGEPAIEWVACKTADEAAKGAGFDKFGAIPNFTIGDLEFANPAFAYAGGVAQATYETPATMIYVRKGVEDYTTPLSDRNLDEFPARWHKVMEGLDVTCFGPAKGAVTVARWTDGETAYCLTFQGLGGEEMSMDTDDLAKLVKGFNEANGNSKETAEKEAAEKEAAEKKAKEEAEQKAKEEAEKNALLSEDDAESKAEKASGGDCIYIDRVNTNEFGECWYAVCEDGDGVRYEYYVTNDAANLINKIEPKKEEKKEEKKDGEHYEGEPVTIFDTVHAEWHQMNDGQWYATFVTYNGTQIFASPAVAGSEWTFKAFVDGKTYDVVYSEESADVGEKGPEGVSSHWQELGGTRWF